MRKLNHSVLLGACAFFLGSTAGAQPSQPALTVLGLYVGQPESEISTLLKASEFTPVTDKTRNRKSASEGIKAVHRFETPEGDRIRLNIAERKNSFGSGRIVGLRYEPARKDDGVALEARLISEFGAPQAVYTLEGDERLYAWERPAPEQSRDFGPLMSISLQTGDAPSLTINQFSRSGFAVPASASRRAAGTGKAAVNRSNSLAGPVD